MPQYKVLTQEDRFFAGKFSPEKMEARLNDLAAEGWRAVGMGVGQPIPYKHDTVIVLLERP